MKITKIRVPNKFFRSTDRFGKGYVDNVAEFTLGVGPCGKTVQELIVSEDEGPAFTFAQIHTDGTGKTFAYPWHLITGRVEIEYDC